MYAWENLGMKSLASLVSKTKLNIKSMQSSGRMKKQLVFVAAKQSTPATLSCLVVVIEQSVRLRRAKVKMVPAKSSGSQLKKSASYLSSRRATKVTYKKGMKVPIKCPRGTIR